MIGWLIIACEVGFWIFVLAGLVTRYIFGQKKLGAILLLCTPVVDLFLLIATIIDVKNGSEATFLHALAAYYIGMTVAFGKRMIAWADRKFAKRFSAETHEIENENTTPSKRERNGWFRHLLGWSIGNALLTLIILLIGDKERTEDLLKFIQLWLFVLVVDFLWSFSYTVFPKKERTKQG